MRTLAIVATLVLSFPGCADGGPELASCIERHGVKADIEKEPNYDADLQRWHMSDGCDLRLDVVLTRNNTCSDDTDVLIAQPIGDPGGHADQTDIYVQDPDASLRDEDVVEGYDDDAILPDDAIDTSFRKGDEGFWVRGDDEELWTVQGDKDFVYIVSDDGVRRLPRDEAGPVCDTET